jgi:two-component system response regulator (stage 0 sporulation protein F)
LEFIIGGSIVLEYKNVLVVDDRLGIRILIEEILTAHGYSVTQAADGYEALELVENNNFDLVLLDMKMSGMDGLETLTLLKKKFPALDVIIMTAYEELDVLNEAKNRGAKGYLSKPFDIEELLNVINS